MKNLINPIINTTTDFGGDEEEERIIKYHQPSLTIEDEDQQPGYVPQFRQTVGGIHQPAMDIYCDEAEEETPALVVWGRN